MTSTDGVFDDHGRATARPPLPCGRLRSVLLPLYGASPTEEAPHVIHGLFEPAETFRGGQRKPDHGLTSAMLLPSSIESVFGSVWVVVFVVLHSSLSPAAWA